MPDKLSLSFIGCCGGGTPVNACELTASITALANTLACRLTEDEITLLGTIFTQLGDTLLTIGTHRSICSSK